MFWSLFRQLQIRIFFRGYSYMRVTKTFLNPSLRDYRQFQVMRVRLGVVSYRKWRRRKRIKKPETK